MYKNFDIVEFDLKKPLAQREIWNYGIGRGPGNQKVVVIVKKTDSLLTKIWFTFQNLIWIIDTSKKGWERYSESAKFPPCRLVEFAGIHPEVLAQVESATHFVNRKKYDGVVDTFDGVTIMTSTRPRGEYPVRAFERMAGVNRFVGVIYDDTNISPVDFKGVTYLHVRESIDPFQLRQMIREAPLPKKGG